MSNIFTPESIPADAILRLAVFVLVVCFAILVVVGGLLTYAAVAFRKKGADDGREPAQNFGSRQVEMAWTVIPILIVVVLFLTTARVVHEVEDASLPGNALEVKVIGHQFWWELRYPQAGVVTANELHVPVGEATRLTLMSADVDHSFWVPELAGKTDLLPGRVNRAWIQPRRAGLFLGQCALYCGTQHAKMLLRVYAQPRAEFDRWLQEQRRPAVQNPKVAAGRRLFEATACVNCHALKGTGANGRFGPDLTHLMARDTLAAGAAANTPENMRRWMEDPARLKPGCLMPAMKLAPGPLGELVAYLETLR